MTQMRIDPLGLLQTAASKDEKVTAAHELNNTDSCPIPMCGRPMVPIIVHGVPSNICHEHRTVLPQLTKGQE